MSNLSSFSQLHVNISSYIWGWFEEARNEVTYLCREFKNSFLSHWLLKQKILSLSTTKLKGSCYNITKIYFVPLRPIYVHVQGSHFSSVIQDFHTIPKLNLLKISPLKTPTPFQSGNWPNSVHANIYKKSDLSGPPHPQKLQIAKISPFKTTTTSQSRNCWKSVLSRPPYHSKMVNLPNSVIVGPAHQL